MLEFTPTALPFLASFMLTVGLALVAAGRQTAAARTFSALMVGLSVWTLCYVLELCSPTQEGKSLWVMAKYLGASPTPALWFVFCLQATGRADWLRRPFLRGALTFWPLLTLGVVWTNGAHGLMWTDLRLEPGLPELQTKHGAYFWVYAAGIYLLMLISTGLFAQFYRTAQPLFRRQGLLLTLGGFVPLAGRMSEDLFGLDLLPRVDEVIFFFLFSGVLFALALFRYNGLRLVPVAHHLVIHHIQAGIVVLDPAGRIVDLNPFAQALFGLPAAEVVGARPADVLKGLNLGSAGEVFGDELTLTRGETTLHFSVQRSPIGGGLGRDGGQAVVLFDVTERREAERQLERLARIDALTGVFNRRHFLERAEREVAQSRRECLTLSVLMLDIDRFKGINDTHGHAAGDAVLREVARTCQSRLRPTDLFARYGGEEFVALLPGADVAEATAVAEQLRQAVEALRIEFAGQPIRVTLSIGVAAFSNAVHTTLDSCMQRADGALYTSKADGRNRSTVAA
ncbi:histidine kinase N-terminal 7TM domain-containing diguanylate cyclase [Deinococcus hopiensis]|uniref:PAS domain S-box-containing protein/diguanylate cyclase (GGDEF) domain-containing protein n=1 Tax=Deinococcus hopiensis KR-140 TaxID=695939 RepID=A0A1W1UDT6_9DEIO|nr:diguanylate cyclase [Deinococcus hopiensis]SMB79237.1 PAS domain S-box-containing protein/diguanylate cyclase (GGDEF) domain-containing protein [Deinococcus hopiensis KR-140]